MRHPLAVGLLGLMLVACQPTTEDTAAATPASPTSSVVEAPVMPVDAPPQEEADPQVSIPEGPDMAPVRVPESNIPCRASLGEAASARLVERCIQVSPATRPPCNAANTCEMIQSEIDRSCAMYGPGETRPEECAA